MKYDNEEQIRKDFARIFNWYTVEGGEYGYQGYLKKNNILRTPEWAEIFSEVGKLIEKSREVIDYKLIEKENEH